MNMKFEKIRVDHCVPFCENPFKVRDDFAMELLVQSISDYGVMFPILVRPLANGTYETVSGHRRIHVKEKLVKIFLMIHIIKLLLNGEVLNLVLEQS